ncbi:hypothetical protein NDU88_004971 [Pleurodeles waltl]|uniref:Uncharacterized protein n=1 Tax=Pleurodeles waltl TaxID=8319 RepID=A0AAV7RLZ6_PLEWA|nr:hypothetical protein NDU88_004971 [Pleurodeles waltl]
MLSHKRRGGGDPSLQRKPGRSVAAQTPTAMIVRRYSFGKPHSPGQAAGPANLASDFVFSPIGPCSIMARSCLPLGFRHVQRAAREGVGSETTEAMAPPPGPLRPASLTAAFLSLPLLPVVCSQPDSRCIRVHHLIRQARLLIRPRCAHTASIGLPLPAQRMLGF